MKILVAADGTGLDARVSKRFGHAPYFLIVKNDDLSFECVNGVGHDQPRHGIDRFLSCNIERVIVGHIGPGAFSDMKNVGFEVYSCPGMSVLEAVEKLSKNAVKELTAPTMKNSVHAARNSGRKR